MDKPRRSAGMRGNPMNAVPEHRAVSTTPSTTPKAKSEPQAPVRDLASRFVKPKVLMGEVTAPRGQQIAAERDAVRAFMLAHRLQPSHWAAKAGVAPGELLAFLSGHARSMTPETLAKLAAAANATETQILGR
jgi:hypothetical protein